MKIIKHLILILALPILLNSCMDYATVKAINKPDEKVALQDFYSPCCGSCGQRIVVEVNGKQYALQINCYIEDASSRLCTPLRIGTQKHVLTYKKRRILREDYYKPVYDTIELKKIYPNVERGEYYDSSLINKPIVLLNAIDTLLINQYYSLTTKANCSDKHLKAIKGYVQIPKDYWPIDKKKIKFKIK